MALTWDANLRNRILVGLIGAPVLLGFSYLGGYYFLALTACIMFLALFEVQRMGINVGGDSPDPVSQLFGAAVILDTYFRNMTDIYLIVIVYFTILFIKSIIKNRENELQGVSYTLFSTGYVVLFIASLILVREFPFSAGPAVGGKFVMCAMLGVWALDTLAYFSGRMFGIHKLMPSVSPKKTIEGSLGGMIGCLAVMVLFRELFLLEISLKHIVAVGVIIGIAGQIGDLLESFIKRKTGIKDSSAILPGHGGVFDRFDSLIFVSPFIYFYLKYVMVS